MVRATFDAPASRGQPKRVAARPGKKVSESSRRRDGAGDGAAQPESKRELRQAKVLARWPISKRKTIVVEQIGSPIRRPASQRATLIGLGLNKNAQAADADRQPAGARMVAKIAHLAAHRRR